MKLQLLLLFIFIQKGFTSDSIPNQNLRESIQGQEISHSSFDLKIKSFFLSGDRSLQEDTVQENTETKECDDHPTWMALVRYIAFVASAVNIFFILVGFVPFLECLLNILTSGVLKMLELGTGAVTFGCIAALMYGAGQKVSLPISIPNSTDILNKTSGILP